MLFIAGGSAATVFALTPLATAARNAGHEVFMAGTDTMAPVIAGVGLPAVSASSVPMSRFIYADRRGTPVEVPSDPAEQLPFTGVWFGRMAADWLGPLLELAREWRPDVVVGGTMMYVAPLLAAHLGVPYVRHTWDAIEVTEVDPGAERELEPELAELGLDRLPEPDLLLEVCPPSLLPPKSLPAKRTLPLRWIAAPGQRRLEPWMYSRGDRPRICVTAGSQAAPPKEAQDYRRRSFEFLRSLATKVDALGTDLVIAAPEGVAEELRPQLPGARVGWIPLDVVARRCDLLVHHGGGVTSMTALSVGLPQVIIPQAPIMVPAASRIADRGAAIVVLPGEDTADAVADACRNVLAGPSYAERAAGIAGEIAALPTPTEVLAALEDLVRN
ncbi:glycosyltransferase [Streptosporangium sp. NPDC001559]|uniref:glycosyltransferase n=1 Tax=Streptosporangium sp. NPDC001559 TaxID=3366187 RepID=UPI0036E522D0